MSRGPYRKPSKLTVKEKTWQHGDVVQVAGTRWIIRHLGATVTLIAANTSNHAITWTTTLDRIPKKASTP